MFRERLQRMFVFSVSVPRMTGRRVNVSLYKSAKTIKPFRALVLPDFTSWTRVKFLKGSFTKGLELIVFETQNISWSSLKPFSKDTKKQTTGAAVRCGGKSMNLSIECCFQADWETMYETTCVWHNIFNIV